MLALLTPIDYGVFGLFATAWLATCAYFSSRQRDTGEYFLAGRSLGPLPLGLSLAVIFVSMLGFTWLPAQAYDHGWRAWIVVLALWLVLPVVAFVAIPLYRGLGVVSLYEYLELRFSPAVRLIASLIFIAWRMLWLVAAIYLPCAAIRMAAGWGLPAWLLAMVIGGLATIGIFLGGMRSSAWSGLLKALAIFSGVMVLMLAIWAGLEGSPPRVLEISRGLGRMDPVQLTFSWTDPWTLWGALPFWVLTVLAFLVADQLSAQRLLAAKSENAARTAYLTCALALSIALPALLYVGTGLLGFYYDHPQEMRPAWVVNIDGKTRLPMRGSDGRPLLDAAKPADDVNFENIDRLVAEGRILQPNNKEPFASPQSLIDPETNRVLIERLAMRKPNNDRLRGEVIVGQDAPQEMVPHFARSRLSFGAAGLLLAALLASALAAIQAGILSVSTVIVSDLLGRFDWGRTWLAERLRKPTDQLTDEDELQIARPLTLLLGAAATVAAMISAVLLPLPTAWPLAAMVSGALGAPLLAVCLLGMFTRRTTAAGALAALSCGMVVAIGLSLMAPLAEAEVVPREYRLAFIWPTIGGFVFATAAGYLLSFVAGRPRSSIELRGLVVGCGELGRRAAEETIPLISVPEGPDEIRWK
jgi:Na+/proline symporter